MLAIKINYENETFEYKHGRIWCCVKKLKQGDIIIVYVIFIWSKDN